MTLKEFFKMAPMYLKLADGNVVLILLMAKIGKQL